MSARTDTVRAVIRGSVGIAIAMGVMNVATYAFVIFAAHLLGPRDYSGVASLMGLLLVVNVLALGLQATGARRVAAEPARAQEIQTSVMAATYRSAIGLGLICLAFTPLIAWGLDLEDWAAAAMIGISVVPLTLMGGQAGILQGRERWGMLSAIYLGMGLGRLGVALIVLPAIDSVFGAMLAVAVSAWIPALVGGWALRRLRTEPRSSTGAVEANTIVREVFGNAHALLAFFALSNLDVIIARARFDETEAGLYAGGLILTKAVLFLPQFVVVIAFPAMASAAHKSRMYLRGLAAVGGIGIIATLGAVVLSSLAVTFIGGSEYSAVEPDIWVFATMGTLLAMIQLMVYEVVARQHRGSIMVVWAGFAAVAVAGMFVDDGRSLARAVAALDFVLLLTLVLVAIYHPAMQSEPAADSNPTVNKETA